MLEEMLIVVVLPCGANVTPSSFTNVAVKVVVVVLIVIRLNLITLVCACGAYAYYQGDNIIKLKYSTLCVNVNNLSGLVPTL